MHGVEQEHELHDRFHERGEGVKLVGMRASLEACLWQSPELFRRTIHMHATRACMHACMPRQSTECGAYLLQTCHHHSITCRCVDRWSRRRGDERRFSLESCTRLISSLVRSRRYSAKYIDSYVVQCNKQSKNKQSNHEQTDHDSLVQLQTKILAFFIRGDLPALPPRS
jgi:hypothetical protein